MTNIGRAELLSALSYALDLTEGQPAGHGVRCCWIGMHLARAVGMSDAELSDTYYTLLLKDAGCSSNAARLCELYLADDLVMKRDFKVVNDTLPQVLRFILSHTGVQAGLAERFRALVSVVRNGGEFQRELIDTRCHRGADIAREMRFSEAVAHGILDLDEHWNGGGYPLGKAGRDISLNARLALMAQVIDVFFVSAGPRAAMREVRGRSGAWFDPDLVAAFETVASDPAFWEGLRAPDINDRVLALEPATEVMKVDEDYLDDIAAAFARVIDAKSPFTSGHSDRVALFADLIAEQLGLDAGRRRWLQRASLLHDVGKLGISNQILDKPGKLDAEEWALMQQHTVLGEQILSRVSAFADLALIASAHHEKLDGSGYPYGRSASDLDVEVRIVTTADIFDALTADRPYRAAMPVERALAIMDSMLDTAIDGDCLRALKSALARLDQSAA